MPSSIPAYEEMVRTLNLAGRFDDAREWCKRAMAHCLEREAQYRARMLDMETQALKVIASSDQDAVRLYLTGVHRPILQLVQSMPDENLPYPLHYVLGRSLLALDLPEEAWFDVSLMHKDITLALALARELDLGLPSADAADGALSQAERLGYGRRDIAALYKALGNVPAQ